MLAGEALGAGADEVDMRRLLEDESGGADGVAKTLHAGDAAGAESRAVHEESVELDAAVAGEKGAATGVEGVVVFHGHDGGLDGLDGGRSALKKAPAGAQGFPDAALVGGDGRIGHGPGPAVKEQNRLRLR